MKKFLHVGCGSARKSRTTRYFNTNAWTEVRLDLNPDMQPDIIDSIVTLSQVPDKSYDGLFSSHNIEHLYHFEVPQALGNFKRVLKDDGHVVIRCPDLQSVCVTIAEGKLMETLYVSSGGPISPVDILFGFRPEVTPSMTYMAHRYGFVQSSLAAALKEAGFGSVLVIRTASYELSAIATVNVVSEEELRKLHMEHYNS